MISGRIAGFAAAMAAAFAGTCVTAQTSPPVVELPAVDVVGVTPLPGLGTPLKDIPANVQVFGGREIARQRPSDVTQFLDQNATSVVAASGQYARGDENNQDRNGRVPGYAVVNLDGQYRLTRELAVFAQVTNLFDRAYQNFGLLGANYFTGPDRTFGPTAGIEPRSEQFRAVGAPRGIWLGLRFRLGDAPGGG